MGWEPDPEPQSSAILAQFVDELSSVGARGKDDGDAAEDGQGELGL